MSTLASQTKEAPAKVDADRLLIVVQGDEHGRYVNFLRAGLTNWELARDIATGDGFADDTILAITEMTFGETCGRDITAEIAEELGKVAQQAIDERWTGFADCATRLMTDKRVPDAWEARQTAAWLNQKAVA